MSSSSLHKLFSPQNHTGGCVATFKKRQESNGSGRPSSVSCGHLEQLVDKLNLLPNIRTAHPPRLPLPDHVHGLVSLDRSPRRVEFTNIPRGVDKSSERVVWSGALRSRLIKLGRPGTLAGRGDVASTHSWSRVIRIRSFGEFIVPASHRSRSAPFQVIKGQINCFAKAFLRWARSHKADDFTEDERRWWKKTINSINAALR